MEAAEAAVAHGRRRPCAAAVRVQPAVFTIEAAAYVR